MTVYITQKCDFIYREEVAGSPADADKTDAPPINFHPEEFGKIKYVFDKSDKTAIDPIYFLTKAKHRLMDFDFKKDHLLLETKGDQTASWMCLIALVQLGFDYVNLIYLNKDISNKNKHYTKVTYCLK